MCHEYKLIIGKKLFTLWLSLQETMFTVGFESVQYIHGKHEDYWPCHFNTCQNYRRFCNTLKLPQVAHSVIKWYFFTTAIFFN